MGHRIRGFMARQAYLFIDPCEAVHGAEGEASPRPYKMRCRDAILGIRSQNLHGQVNPDTPRSTGIGL